MEPGNISSRTAKEGSAVNLKTYQAYSMAEALAAVKRDLGADAVILNTVAGAVPPRVSATDQP